MECRRHFEDRASTLAINRNFPKPSFRVKDSETQLEILTASFHLTYDKQRFSPNGLVATFTSKQTDWGGEWRYGGPAKDNLGARREPSTGPMAGASSGRGSSPGRVSPAWMTLPACCLTARALWPPSIGDRIDGYLFHYGHDYKGAIESYYAISGKQPVIPRWCLGNWWSRYFAYSADEYLALMDEFQKHEVPLSVAVVDMDWHVVKGDHVPHVGWTGYTWNKSLFPDPEGFTGALHDRGLKITLNDHPHAGIHHHEEVYEELSRALGHDTAHKAPVLFDPTSPEFMHAYFNVVHRKLEEQGCDFWWIDWQQGPYTRIPGIDPLWLLNHFQFLDLERKQGAGEALVFSRYAGPGSHRYPVGFSGDTHMTWSSLQFQPEFTATAANIGYGWWSHDIGGHMEGYRDDELAARWVQFGTFSPIMRGTVYDGDREIAMYRSLHRIPVLAPEGAIIPLDRERVPTNGCANPDAFEMLVVVGRDGEFTITESTRDDRIPSASGEAVIRHIPIKFQQAKGRLTVNGAGKAWIFRFISLEAGMAESIRVLINGEVSGDSVVNVNTLPLLPSVAVSVSADASKNDDIVIELGPNPQLEILNYADTFAKILVDFQIENNLKDRIWEVLNANQPTAVKVGRLLSLELDKAVAGPFMELILSDSRRE
ncbi:unnamed protein product [Parascedosporium putredinis]|uniref:Glycoside hydrolase family 31 TIM barrel domain-containing protein n=1 Tax=Parascedosporium putredinis TaxID=1442378 RepID=A0A9P1H1X5_9PEZI|nr:unnamed protein product [Parascedosporium putredinis]CAI7993127.1 unnamed protein product [Parascedosporium putredinis]